MTYVGRAATAHEPVDSVRCQACFQLATGDGTLQCAPEGNARHQQRREQSEELHLGSSSGSLKGGGMNDERCCERPWGRPWGMSQAGLLLWEVSDANVDRLRALDRERSLRLRGVIEYTIPERNALEDECR